MARSLLAAPPPQFLGFGTGSSSSSTSPSWRSNGVLFCLDRLSTCWKKKSFSCSSLLIFWIVSWFVSPCHSTTTYCPWVATPTAFPAFQNGHFRWRPTGGLFHTLQSQVASSSAFSLPLRGTIAMVRSCLFQALHVMKCCVSCGNLQNLYRIFFSCRNFQCPINLLSSCLLLLVGWDNFGDLNFTISFWNLLVNWTPYQTPGQSPSLKGLHPHVGS